MAFPTELAGQRNLTTLQYALIQMADTALSLDTRAKAIQHAYKNAVAADYPANGAAYAQLMTDLTTFLASPAWTAMMAFVDNYRDISR